MTQRAKIAEASAMQPTQRKTWLLESAPTPGQLKQFFAEIPTGDNPKGINTFRRLQEYVHGTAFVTDSRTQIKALAKKSKPYDDYSVIVQSAARSISDKSKRVDAFLRIFQVSHDVRDLESARAAASEINHKENLMNLFEVLVSIARISREATDIEAVRKLLFEQARQFATWRYVRALMIIAALTRRSKDFDAALEAFNDSHDPQWVISRQSKIKECVLVLADLGDIAGAIKFVQSQPAGSGEERSAFQFETAALSLASSRRFEELDLLLPAINEDAKNCFYVLREIVKHLVEMGEVDKAFSIAQTDARIDDGGVLRNIAQLLAENGRYNEAIELADTLREPAQQRTRSQIAKVLCKHGDYHCAVAVLRTLDDDGAEMIVRAITDAAIESA